MSSPEAYLTKGPMPEISKMKLQDLRSECQMWRNVWGWVPPEVKYYVARVGQQVGITQRNYKRYLGTLIDTHWELQSLEIGTVDKVYDQVRDKTYWEKKIVVMSMNSLIDIQWVKERKEWEQFEAETQAQLQEDEQQKSAEPDTKKKPNSSDAHDQ